MLREYALPELGADVILNWITQPDGAQHKFGPHSREDLLPTLLTLQGLPLPALDRRVLAEAHEGGPEAEKIPVDTRSYVTNNTATGYRGVLQVTRVGRFRYLDKSWRSPR